MSCRLFLKTKILMFLFILQTIAFIIFFFNCRSLNTGHRTWRRAVRCSRECTVRGLTSGTNCTIHFTFFCAQCTGETIRFRWIVLPSSEYKFQTISYACQINNKYLSKQFFISKSIHSSTVNYVEKIKTKRILKI